MNEEKIYEFSLYESEANVVLGALGNLPYIQAQPLIAKLQAQAAKQQSIKEENS